MQTARMAGRLPFNKPGGGGQGVKFMALLGAKVVGGKVTVSDQGIQIDGADEAVLWVSAGTDLRNPGFEEQVRGRFNAVREKSFATIESAAVADHRS